jgi:hypothetical protein
MSLSKVIPKSLRKFGSKLIGQAPTTVNDSINMTSIKNNVLITKKFNNIHDIKNVIDFNNDYHLNFLNHMYLDNYINGGTGNTGHNTLTILEKLIPLVNHTKYIELKRLLKDGLIIIDIINSYDFQEYKDKILEMLDEYPILIPCGWIDQNSGHLISIYVKKTDINYNIVITNSGEGSENFIDRDPQSSNQYPICHECTNLSRENIIELLYIIKVSINYKLYKNNNLFENLLKKLDIDIDSSFNTSISRDTCKDSQNFIKKYNETFKTRYNINYDDLYGRLYKIIYDYIYINIDFDLDSLIFNIKEKYNYSFIKDLKYYILLIAKIIIFEKYTGINHDNSDNKTIKIYNDSLSRIVYSYETIIKNFFYDSLNSIIYSNKTIIKTEVFTDKMQFSGSCSFYGIYYFIKYFLGYKFFNVFYENSNNIISNEINNYILKNKLNVKQLSLFYLINKESSVNINYQKIKLYDKTLKNDIIKNNSYDNNNYTLIDLKYNIFDFIKVFSILIKNFKNKFGKKYYNFLLFIIELKHIVNELLYKNKIFEFIIPPDFSIFEKSLGLDDPKIMLIILIYLFKKNTNKISSITNLSIIKKNAFIFIELNNEEFLKKLFNILNYINIDIYDFIFSFQFYNNDNIKEKNEILLYPYNDISDSITQNIKLIFETNSEEDKLIKYYLDKYNRLFYNHQQNISFDKNDILKLFEINNFKETNKNSNRYLKTSLNAKYSFCPYFTKIFLGEKFTKCDIIQYQVSYNYKNMNLSYKTFLFNFNEKLIYTPDDIKDVDREKFILLSSKIYNNNKLLFSQFYINFLFSIDNISDKNIFKNKIIELNKDKDIFKYLLDDNNLLIFLGYDSLEDSNINTDLELLMGYYINIELYNNMRSNLYNFLNKKIIKPNIDGYSFKNNYDFSTINMDIAYKTNGELIYRLYYNSYKNYTPLFIHPDHRTYLTISNTNYTIKINKKTNGYSIINSYLDICNLEYLTLINEESNSIYLYALKYNILINAEKLILNDINNSKEYNIIIKTENTILNLLYHSLDNALLLENNKNYSFLIFYNNTLLNDEKYSRIKSKIDIFYKRDYIKETQNIDNLDNYFIIDMHYTLLFPTNNDINSISIYIYLLLINNDVIFTLNIYKKYFNLIQTIYRTNDENIFDIDKCKDEYKFPSLIYNLIIKNIDTPLWCLFMDKTVISKDIIKNLHYIDYFLEDRLSLIKKYKDLPLESINVNIFEKNKILYKNISYIIQKVKIQSKLYKNKIIKNNNNEDLKKFIKKLYYIYNSNLGIESKDYKSYLHLLTFQMPIFIKTKYIFIQYTSYIFSYMFSFYCIIFFYHMNLLIFYNKKL